MEKTILIIFSCLFLVACDTKDISELVSSKSNFEEIAFLSIRPTLISSKEITNQSSLSDIEILKTSNNNDHDKELNLLLESSNQVKQVDDFVYQTVLDEGENLSFYTWRKNQHNTYEIIDLTVFNNQLMNHGIQIGNFYYQLWQEYEDFYLSYHDLELDLTFIDKAKHGKVPTSNAEIGMSKDELISYLGEPIVTDWYHGGTYYQYNKLAFILDDDFNVTAIKMPGNRVKILLKDVPTILGEPSEIIYDELDNTIFYSYMLDQFTLSFEAEEKLKQVRNVWVIENAQSKKQATPL